MKQFSITVPIQELDYAELSDQDKHLVDVAKEMTSSSYAPYSRFHVGAAILLDNGEIVRGSNQENAAFPSSLCAERTACYQASALYPGVPMKKIAIAAAAEDSSDKSQSPNLTFQPLPISPCGACRQALLEYEHLYGPIQVILYGHSKTYILPSVSSLLPLAFTDF
ncbi:MAG: cytidine deaminase [Bacteroidales bacterium]|nr:cytidine deaminase [Bacteroidales bacterium]